MNPNLHNPWTRSQKSIINLYDGLDDQDEIMRVKGLTLLANEKDEIQVVWFLK